MIRSASRHVSKLRVLHRLRSRSHGGTLVDERWRLSAGRSAQYICAMRPCSTTINRSSLFIDKPKSLARNPPEGSIDITPPPGIGGLALRVLGYYSAEARRIRGARTLYDLISTRADDEAFLQAVGLEKSFRTSYAVLVLHVWLCLGRIRTEGLAAAPTGQMIYDFFSHDCERRIAAAGVKVMISKWMRELEKNFYGAAVAYDMALKPEAPPDQLQQALWRNVYATDESPMPSGPEAAGVEALGRYVRREVASLALTDMEQFARGHISFSTDYIN